MARLFESSAVYEVSRPGGAPARFLIGRLPEGAEPLEEAGRQAAPDGVVPGIAADDHRVLASLLEEAAGARPADWEGSAAGLRARGWRLGTNGLRGRMDEVLEALEIRPLCAATAGGLAAVVPLSDANVRLAPIHRGIRGVSTFEPATFLRLVADYARVYELEGDLRTPAGSAAALARLASLATGHHAFLLVLPGGVGRILRVRQALELSTIRAVPRSPTLRSLDLVLLESLVLRTVLGIPDPHAADHPHVTTEDAFEALVSQVEAGRLQAGFALNPPPAWEVRAVLEARQRLPARTLQIDPLHPLEAVRHLQP